MCANRTALELYVHFTRTSWSSVTVIQPIAGLSLLHSFELPNFRHNKIKWYNMSLVPVLAVYNTPDGQAPWEPSATTDPKPALLSRVSSPIIAKSELEPTSESYPLSPTSLTSPAGPSTSKYMNDFLPRRPSWETNSSAPRRDSYDDDTIASSQAPIHMRHNPSASSSKQKSKDTPLAPSRDSRHDRRFPQSFAPDDMRNQNQKLNLINQPPTQASSSSSPSHASWWKSKPKSIPNVANEGSLDRFESEPSKLDRKKTGSNSIPLGIHGSRRAPNEQSSTNAELVSTFDDQRPGPSSRNSLPRPAISFPRPPSPSCNSLPGGSERPSATTRISGELDNLGPSEQLERLRQQVSDQEEEIRGYKRTLELMLDGERELTEDVKRLKTEREQTLDVLWRMQAEAFHGEEVKPAHNVISAYSFYHSLRAPSSRFLCLCPIARRL